MVPEVPVFGSTLAEVLWLVVTVLMPVLVGLITSPRTPAKWQSLLLTGASLLNGVLSEALAAGDGFNWRKAATQAVVAFVIAAAAHWNIWKPLGVTRKAQQLGASTPPVGPTRTSDPHAQAAAGEAYTRTTGGAHVRKAGGYPGTVSSGTDPEDVPPHV